MVGRIGNHSLAYSPMPPPPSLSAAGQLGYLLVQDLPDVFAALSLRLPTSSLPAVAAQCVVSLRNEREKYANTLPSKSENANDSSNNGASTVRITTEPTFSTPDQPVPKSVFYGLYRDLFATLAKEKLSDRSAFLMARYMDANGDGTVSEEEFIRGLRAICGRNFVDILPIEALSQSRIGYLQGIDGILREEERKRKNYTQFNHRGENGDSTNNDSNPKTDRSQALLFPTAETTTTNTLQYLIQPTSLPMPVTAMTLADAKLLFDAMDINEDQTVSLMEMADVTRIVTSMTVTSTSPASMQICVALLHKLLRCQLPSPLMLHKLLSQMPMTASLAPFLSPLAALTSLSLDKKYLPMLDLTGLTTTSYLTNPRTGTLLPLPVDLTSLAAGKGLYIPENKTCESGMPDCFPIPPAITEENMETITGTAITYTSEGSLHIPPSDDTLTVTNPDVFSFTDSLKTDSASDTGIRYLPDKLTAIASTGLASLPSEFTSSQSLLSPFTNSSAAWRPSLFPFLRPHAALSPADTPLWRRPVSTCSLIVTIDQVKNVPMPDIFFSYHHVIDTRIRTCLFAQQHPVSNLLVIPAATNLHDTPLATLLRSQKRRGPMTANWYVQHNNHNNYHGYVSAAQESGADYNNSGPHKFLVKTMRPKVSLLLECTALISPGDHAYSAQDVLLNTNTATHLPGTIPTTSPTANSPKSPDMRINGGIEAQPAPPIEVSLGWAQVDISLQDIISQNFATRSLTVPLYAGSPLEPVALNISEKRNSGKSIFGKSETRENACVVLQIASIEHSKIGKRLTELAAHIPCDTLVPQSNLRTARLLREVISDCIGALNTTRAPTYFNVLAQPMYQTALWVLRHQSVLDELSRGWERVRQRISTSVRRDAANGNASAFTRAAFAYYMLRLWPLSQTAGAHQPVFGPGAGVTAVTAASIGETLGSDASLDVLTVREMLKDGGDAYLSLATDCMRLVQIRRPQSLPAALKQLQQQADAAGVRFGAPIKTNTQGSSTAPNTGRGTARGGATSGAATDSADESGATVPTVEIQVLDEHQECLRMTAQQASEKVGLFDSNTTDGTRLKRAFIAHQLREISQVWQKTQKECVATVTRASQNDAFGNPDAIPKPFGVMLDPARTVVPQEPENLQQLSVLTLDPSLPLPSAFSMQHMPFHTDELLVDVSAGNDDRYDMLQVLEMMSLSQM